MVIKMYLTMSVNRLTLSKRPVNDTSVCYCFDADRIEGGHSFEMLCDFTEKATAKSAELQMWEGASLDGRAQEILAWAQETLI